MKWRAISLKKKILVFKNTTWFAVAIALMLSSSTDRVQATHAAGADLTYRCLGGLVYEVNATFYRDCGGTMEPGNVTISYKSASCGYTRTALANKLTVNNGTEITLPCATSPSTCNGGNSSGIRKWVYRAIITLPASCSDWVFSYRICCRNCSITTIQTPCASNSELYVEATLNNQAAPGNNSPVFSNVPIAFVCLAQNFNYNQGVYDTDGDSIAYELIAPKISATNDVTFIPPASSQSPVVSSTPFLLNTVTGDINFTASALQITVLAVRVKEYRDGMLIGTTIRDIQVYVQNCFNTIPAASGINGTGNFVTTACAGQQLCFTIHTSDADTNQLVAVNVSNPIQGSVISQTAGNRPDIQFCWTPGQNEIGPNPRIFTVTVYDNACPFNGVQTFSYTIYVQGPITSLSSVNPSCYGGNNGSASVSVTGNAPFTYAWNTIPPQTNAVATGLSSGNYGVVVTDASGCSSTSNVTVLNPPVSITANCVVSGVNSCQAGNNGFIQTTITGGTGPYFYQWNNGASTSSVSNLGSGTYTVTVTDAGGCTATAIGIIPQASGAVSATITSSQVLCYGGNTGSIGLSVSGGTPPYNYQWNNGSSTQNINNLTAGNYSVTITDVNGCSTNTMANVTQPLQSLQISMTSIQDVICFGDDNGSVSISVNGGTPPYTYYWNNGATSQNVNSLSAGLNTVTVTDFNGCNSLMSFTINEPALPLSVIPVSIVDISCIPGSTGSIDISVNGGIGPYSYLWSNGSTTEDLINLQPGSYTLTVTDISGCSGVSTYSIADHSAGIVGSIGGTQNVLCFNGSNGLIDIDVNGGQAPYSYLWSNGMTTQDISSLSAGTYTVTITDINGCTSNISVIIQQPSSPLIPQIQISNPINCNGGANGSFNLVLNGGTAPYNFMWSNGSTNQNPSGLTAGIYTVTITDANGCNAIISDSISQPANPMAVILYAVSGNACDSMQTSSITPQISGGIAPFNYIWSTGATTAQISGFPSGVYTVSVTDSNGCTVVSSIQATGVTGALMVSANITQPNCTGGQMGSVTLNVSGGLPGYSFLWSTGATTPSLNGLLPGIYSVTVTDSSGCLATADFQILDLTSVTIHLNGPATICIGDMATLTTDSLPGATYQWYYGGFPLNGATSNTFITPAAGVYSIAVTSPCGNFMSNQIEIIVRSIENVSVSNHQIICPPEQVQLFAAGGVTYQWTPATNITFANVPDPIVNPVVSTTYTVTITNEFGCKTDLHVEVGVMCDSLFVPNGFSPNGDGTNDGYVIDGIENYPGNKLWVYSRWGTLVYKAKDYRNNWDGTSNVSGIFMGKKVQTGTYYFILDLNDGSKPKSGYIIIRR